MVAELTTAAPSLVVSRERDFAVRNADKLLTGTIDRLVLVRARDYRPLAAEVIDFKTDALAAQGAAGEAMLNEKYAPQLAAYRQAVSQFTGLAPERVFTTLLATEAEE